MRGFLCILSESPVLLTKIWQKNQKLLKLLPIYLIIIGAIKNKIVLRVTIITEKIQKYFTKFFRLILNIPKPIYESTNLRFRLRIIRNSFKFVIRRVIL